MRSRRLTMLLFAAALIACAALIRSISSDGEGAAMARCDTQTDCAPEQCRTLVSMAFSAGW